MTEFKIGDIVRLTKGEPDKAGYQCKVRKASRNSTTPYLIGLPDLHKAKEDGWTVELIERPAPPLPTKPSTLGWATWEGERCIVRRNAGGAWSIYDESGVAYVASDEDLSDFTEAVLIPKELADRVAEWSNRAYRPARLANGILQQIADHLKGENDE